MYFVFVFFLLLFSSVNVTDNERERKREGGGETGKEEEGEQNQITTVQSRKQSKLLLLPPTMCGIRNAKCQISTITACQRCPLTPPISPLSFCQCWCAVRQRVEAIECARQAGTPPFAPLRFIQLKTSLPVLAFNLIDRWTWTIEENTQDWLNLIWRCCYTL